MSEKVETFAMSVALMAIIGVAIVAASHHPDLVYIYHIVVALVGIPFLGLVLYATYDAPRAIIKRYLVNPSFGSKNSKQGEPGQVSVSQPRKKEAKTAMRLAVLVSLVIFVAMGHAIWQFFTYGSPWIWYTLAIYFVPIVAIISPSYYRTVVFGAISSVIYPITVGWACVVWMQVVFNLFDINTRSVRLFENHLGYVSFEATRWIDYLFPDSILFTLSLILVTFLNPKLQLVTRGENVKSAFHSAATILACISGFTFLSQVPFKYQDSQDRQRLEARRLKENSSNRDDLRYLAAVSIQSSVSNMAEPTRSEARKELTQVFDEINDAAPYRYHSQIIEHLVAEQLGAAARTNVQLSDTLASTEKRDGFDVLAPGADNLLREPVDLPNTLSGQVWAGLGTVFSQLVGHISPEGDGLGQKFLSALVDKEADYFYDHRVRPILKEHLSDILPLAPLLTTHFFAKEYGSDIKGDGEHMDVAVDKRDIIGEEVKHIEAEVEVETTPPKEEVVPEVP